MSGTSVKIVKIKWDFDKVNAIAEKTMQEGLDCEATHKARRLKWLKCGMRFNPKNIVMITKHSQREDGTHIQKCDLINAILEYYFEEVEHDKH